jgi:hypothetical protein
MSNMSARFGLVVVTTSLAEDQQMLLNKVFEVGIKYDGTIPQTPVINPALVDNYLAGKREGCSSGAAR